MKIYKKVEKERTVIHKLGKYEFPKRGQTNLNPFMKKKKKTDIPATTIRKT